MDMQKELANLQKLTPSELRQRYEEVFDEPSRSGNKQYLIKRIAWGIQANAEGALSDRARQRAMELANDTDLRLYAPLPANSVRIELPEERDPRLPMPGGQLTREYKGATIVVTVLERGFEYQGQVFRTLSAVAKQITGTHINGFYFFKLKGKGK